VVAVQVRLGVAGVPEATKPNVVFAPALTAPLYDALDAVTVFPDALTVAFHEFVTVVAEPYPRVTRHDLIAVDPAVTVTSAW
jgi:hypothetical protein